MRFLPQVCDRKLSLVPCWHTWLNFWYLHLPSTLYTSLFSDSMKERSICFSPLVLCLLFSFISFFWFFFPFLFSFGKWIVEFHQQQKHKQRLFSWGKKTVRRWKSKKLNIIFASVHPKVEKNHNTKALI